MRSSGIEMSAERRMVKLKERIRLFRANARRGVSLAVVLCVSAFFAAFAAAILYTAGMVTSQSNQRLLEERCYQLASSFAKVLDAQLTSGTNKASTDAGSSRSFYDFANMFLDDSQYLEYSEDYADASQYQFLVSDTNFADLSTTGGQYLPEEYGNIRITLSKERDSSEGVNGGSFDASSAGNYSSQIENIENITVRSYSLTVSVTAYYDDVTYTYSTEYSREEKYKVNFSNNGNTIVWDAASNQWKRNNTGGQTYTPSGKIDYSYDTNTTTSCVFKQNTYTEGGGS